MSIIPTFGGFKIHFNLDYLCHDLHKSLKVSLYATTVHSSKFSYASLCEFTCLSQILM